MLAHGGKTLCVVYHDPLDTMKTVLQRVDDKLCGLVSLCDARIFVNTENEWLPKRSNGKRVQTAFKDTLGAAPPLHSGIEGKADSSGAAASSQPHFELSMTQLADYLLTGELVDGMKLQID